MPRQAETQFFYENLCSQGPLDENGKIQFLQQSHSITNEPIQGICQSSGLPFLQQGQQHPRNSVPVTQQQVFQDTPNTASVAQQQSVLKSTQASHAQPEFASSFQHTFEKQPLGYAVISQSGEEENDFVIQRHKLYQKLNEQQRPFLLTCRRVPQINNVPKNSNILTTSLKIGSNIMSASQQMVSRVTSVNHSQQKFGNIASPTYLKQKFSTMKAPTLLQNKDSNLTSTFSQTISDSVISSFSSSHSKPKCNTAVLSTHSLQNTRIISSPPHSLQKGYTTASLDQPKRKGANNASTTTSRQGQSQETIPAIVRYNSDSSYSLSNPEDNTSSAFVKVPPKKVLRLEQCKARNPLILSQTIADKNNAVEMKPPMTSIGQSKLKVLNDPKTNKKYYIPANSIIVSGVPQQSTSVMKEAHKADLVSNSQIKEGKTTEIRQKFDNEKEPIELEMISKYCSNGCGFYNSPNTGGLCSKCFKDSVCDFYSIHSKSEWESLSSYSSSASTSISRTLSPLFCSSSLWDSSTFPPTSSSKPHPTTFFTPPPTTFFTPPPPTTFFTPPNYSTHPLTSSSTPPPTSSANPPHTTFFTPHPTTFFTPHPTIFCTPSLTTFFTPPTSSTHPLTSYSTPPQTSSSNPPLSTFFSPSTTIFIPSTTIFTPSTTIFTRPPTSFCTPPPTSSATPLTSSLMPPPTSSSTPPHTSSSMPPHASSSMPPHTSSSTPPHTSSSTPLHTSSSTPPDTSSTPPHTSSSTPPPTIFSSTPPPTTSSSTPPPTTSSSTATGTSYTSSWNDSSVKSILKRACINFKNQRYEILKAKLPGFPKYPLQKMISKEWKALSIEEKLSYDKVSKKNKANNITEPAEPIKVFDQTGDNSKNIEIEISSVEVGKDLTKSSHSRTFQEEMEEIERRRRLCIEIFKNSDQDNTLVREFTENKNNNSNCMTKYLEQLIELFELPPDDLESYATFMWLQPTMDALLLSDSTLDDRVKEGGMNETWLNYGPRLAMMALMHRLKKNPLALGEFKQLAMSIPLLQIPQDTTRL